jgi:hypothetical protein
MTRILAVFPAAALIAVLTAGAQAQSPPAAPAPDTPAASSCETTGGGTSATTDANVAKPTVEPEGDTAAARTPVPNQPNTTATTAHTDCVRPAPSPNRG